MTIEIPTLKQLVPTNSPQNLIDCMRALLPVLQEIADNINATNGELIQTIELSQPSGTNTIKVTITKENEETIESNDLTIIQPS